MGWVLLGIGAAIAWALSQKKGGGSAPVEAGPDTVLFEGRYWQPNELRAELRDRYNVRPTAAKSVVAAYKAGEAERTRTGRWSDASKDRFFGAGRLIGLHEKTVPELDAVTEAMRQVGIDAEWTGRAHAQYVAFREPLVDPWAEG